MRCWNPLQADKYLYTWLPDLIAFCKGDGVGVALNAVPQHIVFFFCYPILCPSQLPHLNKNMSSMLDCPQKDWSRAEGKSARYNRTHVTLPEWRCCILLLLFLNCACRVSVLFQYMESCIDPVSCVLAVFLQSFLCCHVTAASKYDIPTVLAQQYNSSRFLICSTTRLSKAGVFFLHFKWTEDKVPC